MKSKKLMLVISFAAITLAVGLTAHAKPPRPGKQFIWVAAHNNPAGVFIPGHWKYTGPGIKGKTWIKGHFNAAGVWIPGYLKKTRLISLKPHRPVKRRVPGHRGSRGVWIPGHWR